MGLTECVHGYRWSECPDCCPRARRLDEDARRQHEAGWGYMNVDPGPEHEEEESDAG